MASSKIVDPNALIAKFLEEKQGTIAANQETYIEAGSGTGGGNNSFRRLMPLELSLPDAGPRIVEAKLTSDGIKLVRNYKEQKGSDSVRVKEDIRVVRSFGDETVDVSINGLKGVPLFIHSTAGLSFYDSNNNNYTNICGIVGMASGQDEDGNTQYRKDHLQKVMLSMTEYDESKQRNIPHKSVVAIDPLGSRGQTCVDCIRSKNNRAINAEGKEIYCDPASYVYMFVTGVYTTTKKPGNDAGPTYQVNKEYNLYDLGDELGVDSAGNKIPIVDIVTPSDKSLKLQIAKDGTPVEGTGFFVKMQFSPMRIKGQVTGTPPILGLNYYLANLQSIQSLPATCWETTFDSRKPFDARTKSEGVHAMWHIEGGIKVDPEQSKVTYLATDFTRSYMLMNTSVVNAGQQMWNDLLSTDNLDKAFISSVDIADTYNASFSSNSSSGNSNIPDDVVTVVEINNEEMIDSTQSDIADNYF